MISIRQMCFWMMVCSAVIAAAALAPQRLAAQPCEVDPQCMTNGMCQPDGSCVGTPVHEGASCNDENPCTTNDRCQSGSCFGNSVANGTPCTDFFGSCTNNDRCQFGFCFGDFVCADDGNECTFDCDIQRGVCGHISFDLCETDCATGDCDPETGDCINVVNKADGTTCDDFDDCTANDRCQAGECGGGGVEPTTPASQFTPTPTPTKKPTTPGGNTPTPTLGPCVGDCNSDGRLTVDELVKAVNIALGNTSLNDCPLFDVNGDQRVTVDELIKGVNAALMGCAGGITTTPATPGTGTPTTTLGPVSPSPTRTQGQVSPGPTLPVGEASVAKRASGTVEVTGSAMLSFSNVFALLIQQAGGIFGGGSGGIAIPIPCPLGGQMMVDCTQDIVPFPPPPKIGAPTYAFNADECAITGSSGTTVNLNGTITLVGTEEGEVCFTSIPAHATLGIPSLTVVAEGVAGTVTAVFTGVTGSITLSGSDPECTRDTLSTQLTGSVEVTTQAPGGTTLNTTNAEFDNTSIVMVVEQFGESCAPLIYTTTINGAATFTTGDNTFAGTYTNYTLRNDLTSGTAVFTIAGTVESECFGGLVQFTTHTPLTAGEGSGCPRGGEVDVTHQGTTDRIRYTEEGGVEIDQGNNGSVDDSFDSCLNPQLFRCPTA